MLGHCSFACNVCYPKVRGLTTLRPTVILVSVTLVYKFFTGVMLVPSLCARLSARRALLHIMTVDHHY